MSNINGYELSRNFWNFAFDNPEKISPAHCAIFHFAIEHCNRLGWRQKFGFPTMMVCDAIGIKKPSTYIKYFNDLVDWGFFVMIEKSKNQYSANIISLTSAQPKKGEALDKAIVKHRDKHSKSTEPINKPINQEPINQKGLISIQNLKIPLQWKKEIKDQFVIGDRTLEYDIIDFQDWYSKKTSTSRTFLAWKGKLWEWIHKNNAKKAVNPSLR